MIGGIVGGLFGAAVGGGLCGQSDEPNKDCTGSTILGAAVGVMVLAVPGALIGGLFPKGD